jgi:dTDP-4-dehydrorhamnose reductase
MRITVTGAAGMLGRDLAARLSAPPGKHALHLIDLPQCDITDPAALRDCFAAARPQAVVHLAAYTDVDGCERDPALAMRVNGDGTRNVAQAAAQAGARLLYISTDYVFDGAKREPYIEDDLPNPLGVYGRSKLAGECAVREHPNSLIVRTAWLYGRHGRHFIGAILERARRGEPLRVVNDQAGCPTWTRHLSNALAALVEAEARGMFHVTGSGTCSWYEFARAIVEEAAVRGLAQPVPVEPITTSQLNRAAPRPAYSVLSNDRLRQLGLPPLPHWRDALRQFLAEAP